MAKLINELTDKELVVLKTLCDIRNSTHEPFTMQLASRGIDAINLMSGHGSPKEIVVLVCEEMRARRIPLY